jgi:hypothetical protein
MESLRDFAPRHARGTFSISIWGHISTFDISYFDLGSHLDIRHFAQFVEFVLLVGTLPFQTFLETLDSQRVRAVIPQTRDFTQLLEL